MTKMAHRTGGIPPTQPLEVRLEPMAFEDLEGERFISLATYRRSGEPVATPVWFAIANSRIVISTFASSGKAKRLRHTGRVQVAPCNFRGLVKASYQDATGIILPESGIDLAASALEEKYGWQWSMFGRKVDLFLSISIPE